MLVVLNVLHTRESFVQVCLWAIVQLPCAVPCVSLRTGMLKIAGVVCPVSALKGGWLKVGSHEGDRRIPLVLIFVPGYGRFYGTKYF